MNNDINWELLSKYLSGESTTEEKDKIEEWVHSNTENEKLYKTVKQIWNNSIENFEPSDIEQLWKNVADKAGINSEQSRTDVYSIFSKRKLDNSLRKLIQLPILKYAAMILIILGAYFIYQYSSTQSADDGSVNWVSVNVENGEKEKIELIDGTVITADAGSKLEYPKDFGKDTRLIKFSGEAYFEVRKKKNVPFILETGNSSIKVLGTKFNVRAWEDAEFTSVAVMDGEVLFGDSKNKVTLQKGFEVSLTKEGLLLPITAIDSNKVLSWMKGELYFENTQLSEIIRQIERWFDVKINFEQVSTKNERLSVYIQKKNLKDNLELIAQLTSTNYSIKDNIIFFTPGK